MCVPVTNEVQPARVALQNVALLTAAVRPEGVTAADISFVWPSRFFNDDMSIHETRKELTASLTLLPSTLAERFKLLQHGSGKDKGLSRCTDRIEDHAATATAG